MDPLSITASVLGLAGTVAKAVQYFDDVRSAANDSRRLAAQCKSLQHNVQSIERLVRRIKVQQDQGRLQEQAGQEPLFTRAQKLVEDEEGRITNLQDELEKFLSDYEIARHSARWLSGLNHLRKRALWPLFKKEADRVLYVASNGIASLNQELQQDQYEVTAEIWVGIRSVAASRDEQDLLHMLDWIAPVPLQASSQAGLDTCHGRPVLDNDGTYQYWSRNPAFELWYSGAPGTGKSFRAHAAYLDLVSQCAAHQKTVLSIFFKSGQESHQKPSNLLQSLLRQLILEQPGSHVTEEVMACWRRGRLQGTGQIHEHDAMHFLDCELRRRSATFLVVDALDEAGAPEIQDQIRVTLAQLRNGYSVSLLVTSRQQNTRGTASRVCDFCGMQTQGLHWICETCQSFDSGPVAACQTCFECGKRCPCNGLRTPKAVYVELKPSDGDIERYCDSVVSAALSTAHESDGLAAGQLPPSGRFVRFHARLQHRYPGLFESIPQTVSKNAGGKFLFAKLYMEYLQSQPTPQTFMDALNGLRQGSADSVEEVGALYAKMIQQCIDPARGHRVDIAQTAFSFLAKAKATLSFDALSVALSVRQGNAPSDTGAELQFDQQEITEATNGMILIDDYGSSMCQPVRFFHETLIRYLETEATKLLPDANSQILEVCLVHLELAHVLLPTDGSWSAQDVMQKYPFMWYAARFWGSHAREASVSASLDCNTVRRIFKLITSPRLARAMEIAWMPHPTVSSDWDVVGGVSPLHICAFYDLSWLAWYLIAHCGLHPDAVEPRYDQSPLFYACRNGSASTVRVLLDANANVNAISKRGRTPLIEAIMASEAAPGGLAPGQDIISMLLACPRLDINQCAPGRLGRLAIVVACHINKPEILEKILSHQLVNVNACDGTGLPALVRAVNSGSLACVRLLSAFKGSMPGEALDHDWGRLAGKRTPLESTIGIDHRHWNSQPDHMMEIVRILLRNGAHVTSNFVRHAIEDGRNSLLRMIIHEGHLCSDWSNEDDQRSLLHLVAASASVEVFDTVFTLLFDNMSDSMKSNSTSAQINRRDKYGSTPLHLACLRGSLQRVAIIEQLLAGGADPHIPDRHGRTAWDLLLSNPRIGYNAGLAKLLGQHATDTTEEQCFYKTPLFLLVECGKAGLLLSALDGSLHVPLNLEPDDYEGKTALQQVVLEDCPVLLEKMCRSNLFDINARTHTLRSALHIAILHNCKKAFEILIQHGADLELRDMWQRTPIKTAVFEQRWDMAVKLVDAGAIPPQDIQLPSEFLYTAIQARSVFTVERLLDAGIDLGTRPRDFKWTALEFATRVYTDAADLEEWRIRHEESTSITSLAQLKQRVASHPDVTRSADVLALLRAREVLVAPLAAFDLQSDEDHLEHSLSQYTSFTYSSVVQGRTGIGMAFEAAAPSVTPIRTVQQPVAPNANIARLLPYLRTKDARPGKADQEMLDTRFAVLSMLAGALLTFACMVLSRILWRSQGYIG